ncbi:MAG: DUF3052 domain-containing protein [Actinomycetota bacterium]
MSPDYSGTPLAKKLGIKKGSRVALVNEPDGFVLKGLPAGARMYERASEPLDVIVFFAESERHLNRRFTTLARFLEPAGGLWIAYPKTSSPLDSDLTFPIVQQVGLDAGLVDNKSCAIDDTWSAVRFVYQLADRPGDRLQEDPAGGRNR